MSLAAVDRDGDRVVALFERGLKRANDREVRTEVGQAPLGLEGRLDAGEIAGRRRQLGLADLDVMEADDRVDVEVAQLEALADDLAVDLAFGRDIDHDVAADMGRAAQPSPLLQPLLAAVVGLDRTERREVPGLRLDAVLREAADALLDLAAAADPPPAADRVDVDAECPGGIEDRRPRRETARAVPTA